MTITQSEPQELHEITKPAELLIKEAREASRRRRLHWMYLLIVLVVLASTIAASGVGRSKPSTSRSGSDRSLTSQVQAAATACKTYLFKATTENHHRNSATLIDAYPTTASNLESWFHNLDPIAGATLMGAPPPLQTLSPSADVSACVLQGNWVLPAGGGAGTNAEGFEVVVIAPDGTGTPVMWGPSAIATASPPSM